MVIISMVFLAVFIMSSSNLEVRNDRRPYNKFIGIV
jgi:hypothetical protein